MNYSPFNLEASWQEVLQTELEKPYVTELSAFVEKERVLGNIYPPKELVFNAFMKTPFDKVKVLIVGQDPYHGPNQAHGLSFSVPHGIAPPPSLVNIFKEIASDLGIESPGHGCLTAWVEQGVMLLNATLTVRQGEPMSHHGKGWEKFTDAVVNALIQREDPVVFALWGKSAQDKCKALKVLPSDSKHVILTAPHPSPLSAYQGFMGCKHFSKINEALVALGETPINWDLSKAKR